VPDRGVINLFQPQLQAGDVTPGERFREIARETVGVEGWRRDQIKPRCRPRIVTAN
jgi:hypothetical protein